MSRVIVDLSMSLDGYIAGPNDGPGHPLGDGGEALFEWMNVDMEARGTRDFVNPPPASREVVDEWFQGGAIISGRRTYDIANGWSGRHPIGVPFFVLSHDPPDVDPGEGAFVTDGIASALEQAKVIAEGRTIALCAADVAQQFLRAGLLDEIQVSVAPVVLGGGVRLFRDGEAAALRQTRAIASEGVTHLRYEVVKERPPSRSAGMTSSLR
jgi:dihydrofolate reductase